MLIVLSCAVALISTLLSWWQITAVSHHYIAARERASKFNTIKLMLNTNHLMGNERGYSNEYLLETSQDELHAKTALNMAREKTDASIQQLKAIPALTARVADAEEGLSIARRTVDDVMTDSTKTPTEVYRAMNALLDATGAFNKLTISVSMNFASKDIAGTGYFYTLLSLGEIRDTLGRMATPYLFSLRYDTPITKEDMTATTKRQARLNVLWLLLGGLKDNPALRDDLQRAREDYQNKTEFLIKTVDNHMTYNGLKHIDAVVFSIQYREGLSNFQLLEQKYLDNLGSFFANQTEQSFDRLVEVIVSLIALLCIIITICIFINMRVLKPLLTLNETIRNVMDDNINKKGADAEDAAEIQNLFKSIDLLDGVFKQQKAETKVLTRKMNEDPLTGIGNRRFFNEQVAKLPQHIPEGTSLWLAIIDVDHFKRINDTWGHPFGDEVLIGLARTLQSNCRAGDFVARFGGEEFAVMFNAESDVQAQKILARFQETIRAMRFVAPDGTQVGITASFGAVQVDDASIETLQQKADAALYQAKAEGRDRVSWA
ncbi:GGDEF domain-containing protein [Scandinavium goeteborgense]|uniref:GGDEF domain-containing protein n=1 Tax=Scandinavium goeteborgense TaxID=1851514 RepID=UPI002166469E|nr:GGDEF domain-containing protein [Scandinavium goeteborgense]MCS2153300.1 GGDEF domain-containing protein [Scandinavium goeteborgense]